MTSTSNSIMVGQSQVVNKPPCFNGANYLYWNTRMKFIQANDLAVWDIIMDSTSIPPKQEGEKRKQGKTNKSLRLMLLLGVMITYPTMKIKK
ncbi:hypothetical protein J1N35_034479 [Gossypium stocksii]|uniref:DUF4219 domain-containing protein n=1 Tax=Gossypium stocksii TaxID=47602 RepID=A0A9D3USY3_9ROSI|nr:hypothetical protein J1N35_034479 [Gossypium stocksii]